MTTRISTWMSNLAEKLTPVVGDDALILEGGTVPKRADVATLPGTGGGSVVSVDGLSGAVDLSPLYQPLDADLTEIAGAGNGAVLAATEASFTAADAAKLDGIAPGAQVNPTTYPVEIGVACSDETTALTAGTGKVTFRLPHAMTLTGVRASLTTAGSTLTTVDINEAGTSVLSTKLTIDANEKTSTTAATAAVISDAPLADDAEITIDIDGAGTGAAGLKVWLIGTRAA